jgi:hypothetical protein
VDAGGTNCPVPQRMGSSILQHCKSLDDSNETKVGDQNSQPLVTRAKKRRLDPSSSEEEFFIEANPGNRQGTGNDDNRKDIKLSEDKGQTHSDWCDYGLIQQSPSRLDPSNNTIGHSCFDRENNRDELHDVDYVADVFQRLFKREVR